MARALSTPSAILDAFLSVDFSVDVVCRTRSGGGSRDCLVEACGGGAAPRARPSRRRPAQAQEEVIPPQPPAQTRLQHASERGGPAASVAASLQWRGAIRVLTLPGDNRPGEPLWVERTLRSTGGIAETHSLHRVHFEAYPRRGGVAACPLSTEYYCARSDRAEYTNNPTMYRTAWARKGGRGIGESLARDDYNTMEVGRPALDAVPCRSHVSKGARDSICTSSTCSPCASRMGFLSMHGDLRVPCRRGGSLHGGRRVGSSSPRAMVSFSTAGSMGRERGRRAVRCLGAGTTETSTRSRGRRRRVSGGWRPSG